MARVAWLAMVRAMPTGSRRAQRGYTYLLMLFVVATAGYALAQFGETWRAVARRDVQAEREFVLDAYAQALASYRAATPDGMSYRPRRIEELLEDTRTGVRRRHLRRLYPDPATGRPDWILRTDALGIVAVCLRNPVGSCSREEIP